MPKISTTTLYTNQPHQCQFIEKILDNNIGIEYKFHSFKLTNFKAENNIEGDNFCYFRDLFIPLANELVTYNLKQLNFSKQNKSIILRTTCHGNFRSSAIERDANYNYLQLNSDQYHFEKNLLYKPEDLKSKIQLALASTAYPVHYNNLIEFEYIINIIIFEERRQGLRLRR